MKGIKILLVVLLIVAALVSIPWRTAPVEEIPAPATATQEPPRATATPTPEPETTPQPAVVVTEYKSEDSEVWLWDTLKKYSPSDEVTAGIMAYYYRESFWRSDAVGGWAISQAYSGEDHCAAFTTAVDAGLADGSTREEFILRAHDQYGGYGLGQWGSQNYTAALYDFAQSWGTSIADAEMQCAFTVQSMMGMPELWAALLEADSPARAGWLIGILYDGTPAGAESISQMAGVFYERWADNG